MSECPELGEGLGSRGFPQEQLLLDNHDEQTVWQCLKGQIEAREHCSAKDSLCSQILRDGSHGEVLGLGRRQRDWCGRGSGPEPSLSMCREECIGQGKHFRDCHT